MYVGVSGSIAVTVTIALFVLVAFRAVQKCSREFHSIMGCHSETPLGRTMAEMLSLDAQGASEEQSTDDFQTEYMSLDVEVEFKHAVGRVKRDHSFHGAGPSG